MKDNSPKMNDDNSMEMEDLRANDEDRLNESQIELKKNHQPEIQVISQKKEGFIGPIKDYPEIFRDNKLLLTGYRCNYTTFRGLFGTVFMWHNETVNIWSHLLGAILFVFLTFYVVDTYPNMQQRASFMYD